MFGKIHDKLDKLLGELNNLSSCIALMRRIGSDTSFEMQKRLDSIETWMELAVDTKADDIADRFDDLLREHSKKGKVTNQVLKDLVRQAVRGQ